MDFLRELEDDEEDLDAQIQAIKQSIERDQDEIKQAIADIGILDHEISTKEDEKTQVKNELKKITDELLEKKSRAQEISKVTEESKDKSAADDHSVKKKSDEDVNSDSDNVGDKLISLKKGKKDKNKPKDKDSDEEASEADFKTDEQKKPQKKVGGSIQARVPKRTDPNAKQGKNKGCAGDCVVF